jgi:hypothetical protein
LLSSVVQVAKTRLYTPQAEDVGALLKLDIVSCDTAGGYAREVSYAGFAAHNLVPLSSFMHCLAQGFPFSSCGIAETLFGVPSGWAHF